MRILVVGKGGREHALVRALAESPGNPELFCFPGSDAIFEIARPVAADGLESLVEWMKRNAIDLCVAGEESYLVKGEGLANLCERNGIPCWGPPKESAQLEASKEFAKGFLVRNGIPTAKAIATAFLLTATYMFLSAEQRARRVLGRLETHAVSTLEPIRIRVLSWALALLSLALAAAIWLLIEPAPDDSAAREDSQTSSAVR